MESKKKALVVTTVASTIDQFCMNDISILLKDYEVHIAANFKQGNNTSEERMEEFKLELKSKNIAINEMNFNRNPFSLDNIRAYRKLKALIIQNKFDLIHCHTPIAAMLTRLAAKDVRRAGTKVIYTAHGFHFFKGAPIQNWLIYYPIEKWLSKYTDVLITINKEDYQRAKKSFKAGRVEYIPGVGIDVDKFVNVAVNKIEKRNELDLPEDAFVVLSVGELNKNKNHEVIIKAIAKLNNPNIYYVICGQGPLENYLKGLAYELGISDKVKLLGFRKDIPEILKAADLFAFPSLREGLPVALMEAMAVGLPVICSNIRGNVDLIEDGKGGYLVKPENDAEVAASINKVYLSKEIKLEMGFVNKEKVKSYSVETVKKQVARAIQNVQLK